MVAKSPISQIKAAMRGQLIDAQHVDYHAARKVHNAMIDKYPALIARCADAADVVTAVNFARENSLLVAVRGGSHNGAGLGTCDDGLVIDLSLMNQVNVDPDSRTVRVQGGSLLGDMDAATHAHGLAVPCGINATTGIGGLTLGGGLGHLTRQCGLTIDNLLEADVVLADGRLVNVSATENPDLFWAIRGGGGNFGIVTSFLFKAYPISTVYGGPMFWELDDTKEVMQWYEQFIKQAPDEINGFFAFLMVPPGDPFPEQLHMKRMCGIVWCYTGDPAKAEAVFEPIRAFKTPSLDLVGTLPVPVLQTMFDGLFQRGMQWYWKADYVNELSDAAIDLHIQFAAQLPTIFSGMHLYPINGAAARVGNDETAWNYRNATWAMVMAGVGPDPETKDALIAWTRNYWTALHPHSAGGAYVNFMMEEGDDRIRATYGTNYERLAAIKAIYDPTNFFRVNQNIPPAQEGRF
ncbi:FAD-binding oxidoreductase [Spirosoma pulveris]